eukprot:jgi/Hompol1/1137/HPOL_001066-RA
MAIIYLKNGLAKYWRRGADNGIQPNEKAKIRQMQMTSFDEPIKSAVVTSKIARPDLLHTLIPIVQAAFAAVQPLDATTKSVQRNTLYTLHLVVKELCSKTLPASRKILLQVAPDILAFVSSIFYDRADTFVRMAGQVDANDPQYGLDDILNLARIALKCLRRLIVHGFSNFDQVPAIVSLLHNLVGYLQSFMQIRQRLVKSTSGVYATLESISILVGKVYLNLAESHFASFVMIPGGTGVSVVQFYWMMLDTKPNITSDAAMEKIVVQALKLIKLFVKNPAFNVLSSKTAEVQRMDQVIGILDTQLFKPDTVVAFSKLLVSHYIKMTQEDLESWNEDPESFLQEEEADHWEYNPRACAEKVFMDLVSKNRALLCPIIIEMLQNASGPTTPETMLAKEAVYTAVGLAAYDLYDWFDFSVWIRSHLIHESRQKDRWLKVMRRRISWVIGKWVAVKAPADIRPTLYDIVLSFMARDDDLVIGAMASPPVHDLLGQLLDRWIEKYDAMGHGKQRKLSALAMASLLGCGNHQVLVRVNAIFGVLTSVASELTLELMTCLARSLVYTFEARDEDFDEDSLDRKRSDVLAERDPVFVNGSLVMFIRSNLAALEQKLGGPQQMQQFMATADSELVHQIQFFTK